MASSPSRPATDGPGRVVVRTWCSGRICPAASSPMPPAVSTGSRHPRQSGKRSASTVAAVSGPMIKPRQNTAAPARGATVLTSRGRSIPPGKP